jgi:Ni/Fe-hydrogenase subunit HybB-like protein
MTWHRKAYAGIDPRLTWTAVGAVVVGVAAFVTGKGAVDASRTFGAFLAAWLFFAGLSMGAVAFRALFRVIETRWARPLTELGGAMAAFVPAAALLLVLVVAGALPRFSTPAGWLSPASLIGRNLALNAILFGLAWLRFRRVPGPGDPPTVAAAVAFLIIFGLVLSAWSFDFILGPDPIFMDTLIGPYLFTGAFLAGTALVTLIAMARGTLSEKARRDATTLVFALSIFWVYLFCSQALTFWYGNLPDETIWTLRRLADGWGAVLWAVLILVFGVPFLGLLHPAGRRSPRVLAVVLVGQLAGLWLNCYWMVVPTFSPAGDGPWSGRDLLVTLGMLGLFALAVTPALRSDPVPAERSVR